jgi:hypothetical protein
MVLAPLPMVLALKSVHLFSQVLVMRLVQEGGLCIFQSLSGHLGRTVLWFCR